MTAEKVKPEREEDKFPPVLPYFYEGRMYTILVARVTENGEPTEFFTPLISVEGRDLNHSVGRQPSFEDAHNEALRWIKDTYRAIV